MESKTVTIVYDKPNLLSLPYHDENKVVRFLDFKPGLNEVGIKVWELVKKENSKRLKIMQDILKVFTPKASEDLTEEEKKKAQAKLDEGRYDISVMEYNDIKTLVENTFEKTELEKYKAQEKKQTQPRANVIKLIDGAIEAITVLEQKANK